MIFRNRVKNSRAMIVIGMAFLAVAISSLRFLHATATFGPDSIDGVRGLLFGIAIGINLLAVRMFARQRGSSGS